MATRLLQTQVLVHLVSFFFYKKKNKNKRERIDLTFPKAACC